MKKNLISVSHRGKKEERLKYKNGQQIRIKEPTFVK